MKQPKSPLREGNKILALVNATNYWLGEIVELTAFEVVLRNASWVPDLGRHHEAIQKGTLNEVEPHGDAITSIPRQGTIIMDWLHDLPTAAK